MHSPIVYLADESTDDDEDSNLLKTSDAPTSDSSCESSCESSVPSTSTRAARAETLKASRAAYKASRAAYKAARASRGSSKTLSISSATSVDSDTESSPPRHRRRYRQRHKPPPVTFFFPIIRKINLKLRRVIGENNFEPKALRLLQVYVRRMRDLQTRVHKFPNKCRLLSKHVCRTLFLFRELSKHFTDTFIYMQRVCELLAIYMFLELRFAAGFSSSKVGIAERIIGNIHLHFKPSDHKNILRIFAYIPYMGRDAEIVEKIFRRLIADPGENTWCRELDDQMYIQYLIAFHHWKDAEVLLDDQEKVITFANKFMKPMPTLKTNLLFAMHLPCYEKRDEATSYFLKNMVFFNDLRNASLVNGLAIAAESADLCDHMEALTLSYSKYIPELSEQPLNKNVRLDPQKASVEASVDLTTPENEAEYIKKLASRALDVELHCSRFRDSTLVQEIVEIIDSSDDEESCAAKESQPAKKNTAIDNPPAENITEIDECPSVEKNTEIDECQSAQKKNTIDVDCSSNYSYEKLYDQLDMSMDIPDDVSTDALLKEISDHTDLHYEVNAEEATRVETVSSKETRYSFEGIIDKDLNNMPSSSSTENISSETDADKSKSCSMDVVKVVEVVEVTESSIGDAEAEAEAATPEIITPIEKNSLVDDTANEKEAEDKENNRTVVANILRDFSQVTTSLSNDSLIDTSEQSKTVDSLFDSNEAPREAVTLSIDTFSNIFESSQENEETFLSHYNKPTLKTYLRKTAKKPEITVNKSEDHCTNLNAAADNGERLENAENNTNSANTFEDPKNKPSTNILFSGKVISLQEDENSEGGYTPTYLKVPEFVEVSPQGSNVVFSMQGRRLSSFPALEVTSSNEQIMPDFDRDIMEDITNDKSFTTKFVKSSIRPKDFLDVEKPPVKRRSVWFSEKTEVHEIEARESKTTPDSSSSSINKINTTINTINTSKQLYQPSTLPSVQFADINANNNSTTTAASNIVKHTIPNTTTTTKPDTAALKSAQEQDLVQRLFPELFFQPNKKQNRKKPSKTTTKAKSSTTNTFFNINEINTITNKRSTSNNIKINHTTAPIDIRRRSVTPVPAKQTLSEFDRYLENLMKKRTNVNTSTTKSNKNNRSRRKKTNKLPVNSITKSLVDLTNDVKLTKKRPIVIVERLSEEILKSKMCGNLKLVSEKNTGVTILQIATKEACSELSQTVESMEFPLKLSETPASVVTVIESVKQNSTLRTETISLSDILTDAVEQENISTISVIEKSCTVDDSRTTCTILGNKVALKRGTEIEESLSDVKKIKLEELEKEQRKECFKKPINSNTLHSRCNSPIETAPASHPPVTDVENDCSESLADRLEALQPAVSQSVEHNNPSNKDEPLIVSQTVEEVPAAVELPKMVLKVRLKRCDSKKSQTCEELKELEQNAIKNEDTMSKCKQLADNTDTCTNVEVEVKRKRHKTGDWALYDVIEDMLCSYCISEINTPPPTPPPLSPHSEDTEPNNNHIRRKDKDSDDMLINYLRVSSMVQEFRKHDNIPDDTPLNSAFLLLFYEYLVCRDDIESMNEIARLIPLVRSKLFGSVDSSNLYLKNRRIRFKSLNQRRAHILLSYDLRSESQVIKNAWSRIFSKRRKMMCSNVYYRVQSPDFIIDEEICSSINTAESPTAEVMRLHTTARKVLPKPATIISPTVTEVEKHKDKEDHIIEKHTDKDEDEEEEEEEGHAEVEVNEASGAQSPQLFSDCSSLPPALAEIVSADSTVVQSKFYTENECPQSPVRRTNCESPPEISRKLVVSRTYSKSYMVQHVFVPPEIEKCIEEQASTIVQIPSTSTLPSSSSQRSSRSSSGTKTRKIQRIMESSTSEEDDDHNDDDYDYQEDLKNKKLNRKLATTSVRRAQRKTKSSHSKKRSRKY